MIYREIRVSQYLSSGELDFHEGLKREHDLVAEELHVEESQADWSRMVYQ